MKLLRCHELYIIILNQNNIPALTCRMQNKDYIPHFACNLLSDLKAEGGSYKLPDQFNNNIHTFKVTQAELKTIIGKYGLRGLNTWYFQGNPEYMPELRPEFDQSFQYYLIFE